MSERKPTPDVLADILGSGPAPLGPGLEVESEGAPRPAATRRSPRVRAVETPKSAEEVRRWEYRVVSCQAYRGWRPRYDRGVEVPNWTQGPLLPGYLNEQGNGGWELVAACSGRPMFGVMDYLQLFFKRPIE
jgi:hypothetical protein